MKTFDRCIFASIAIGIWAYVLVQNFKPESLSAQKRLRHTKLWVISSRTHDHDPTTLMAKCPKWVDQNIQSFSEEHGLPV